VTGAASGIGRAVVEVFAEAGARVAGLDVDREGLDSLARDTGILALTCDVTDPDSTEAAFDEVVLAHGGLDILISNAGAASQSPIADVSLTALRQSFGLNFFSHQITSQTAMRIFRRQGRGGLILFNISNQSVNPGRNFGPYGIPKAATLALMRQYALDHGREGIRVNGVNAGRVRTGLLNEAVIAERAKARGLTPEAYMAGNLIGAEVTARDVAEAFLHLAQMPKVNAALLTVDGGAMETCLR
jgi:NAD(P)-dependent dehydrogenase (short-subunit alcohol dehydrogenase family)